MGDRFDTLHKDYRDHVERAASADSWRGTAATAFKNRGQVTKEEYAGARDEARAVASLLKEAHTDLKKEWDKLVRLKDEAREACMMVTSQGHCSIDLMALESKDKAKADYYRKHLSKLEADQQAHTKRIDKVVQEIRDVDNNFKRALMANPSDKNGLQDGFNGALEGKIDDFNVDEAVDLAREGGDMSNTELSRYNGILTKHSDDPGFAQGFAKRMGAQGTLDFWGSMHPYGKMPESRRKLLAQTRKAMGETLGKATRSNSPAMERWEEEMEKAGRERQGEGRMKDPYGYQLMTDLMRDGDYDDGFLKEYGDSLVKFEKEEAKAGTDLKRLWGGHLEPNRSGEPVLADVTNTWGNDPMAGLMEGMGHNPGASTEFFSDKGT
ncbi:MAG: hypothetical protein ACRD1T_20550, partial [Acidimicrobiia bacterium]